MVLNGFHHTSRPRSRELQRLGLGLVSDNLGLVIGALAEHVQLNRQVLSIMGLVNDRSCNQRSVAIESALQFLCQCDKFTTLRRKVRGKIIFTANEWSFPGIVS